MTGEKPVLTDCGGEVTSPLLSKFRGLRALICPRDNMLSALAGRKHATRSITALFQQHHLAAFRLISGLYLI
jgi:hypothetical protein